MRTPRRAKAKVRAEVEPMEPSMQPPSHTGRWAGMLVLLIVIGSAIGAAAWTMQGGASSSESEQPVVAAPAPVTPSTPTDEATFVKQTVETVGKVITLPTGEDPLVATVLDADKVRAEQAFYRDVQNGDLLLVYAKASKAILYRPSTNLIVNAGPLSADKAADAKAITVEVRNGTPTAGLAKALSDTLAKDDARDVFEFLKPGTAKSNAYRETVVVDLSGGTVPEAIVQSLATRVNGTIVKSMPAGEAASNAQLVVIIGSSQ